MIPAATPPTYLHGTSTAGSPHCALSLFSGLAPGPTGMKAPQDLQAGNPSQISLKSPPIQELDLKILPDF